jgi:hypothetical protein
MAAALPFHSTVSRALLLAALLAPLARADDTDPGSVQSLAGKAQAELQGSSVTLGGGYVQGTFKARLPGTQSETQITDNGQANLLLDYAGKDRVLARVPLRMGNILVGWSFTGTVGQFSADRQLVNSAFTGSDLGTKVKGQYAAVAPSLFVRFGPLYAGAPVYWSFGAAAGVGLMRTTGDALFGGPVLQTLGGGFRPAYYEGAWWRLDVGRWALVFNSKYFVKRDPDLSNVTFESYGLCLGYRISF